MAKANVILDNLIAEGKARPMIVVMPLGYGDMEMIKRGWIAWQDQALVRRNFTLFSEVLYKEVMPLVTSQYPISPKRVDHAIAGLSMGGAETLLVGLQPYRGLCLDRSVQRRRHRLGNFPQLFPAITPATGGIAANSRLLWISCGTEDGLLEPYRKLIAWLHEQGLAPMAVETPGMHVWMVWRDNLAHFAPLLFQPKH